MLQVKEINGKPHVRVKDLKPNRKNEEIYNQSAVVEMSASFEERKKKGLVPNLQPVTYWSCGMIDIGHTRVLAGIQSAIEWVWAIPSDSPRPDGSAPYDEVKHTLDGNIVRKKNWTVKLGEWQAAKDAYRKQYGIDMPSSVENPLIESIGTSKKTLAKVAEIKVNKPELMKVIDNGGGVDHNYKLATGQLDSTVRAAKKNGLDLSTLFKDTRTRSKVITKAIKYAKDMRDMKMEFDDFNVSPFEHDDCGRWESGAFTTFLSHTFMSSIAGVLKEMGYNVKTASGHKDDPDVYLIDEDEKIEVKATQFRGHGAGTTWKGGRGARNAEFLLIAHDADFTRICVIFSTLTHSKDPSKQRDWKKQGPNTTEMPLKKWYDNHKDIGDYEFWKGEVFEDTGTGQVQMSLASVV